MKRKAGILLPIFSLPSNYGIGTLGKEAYRFVDFLCEAKQTYWQILPVGQTSFGDSPYQSFSSYAGNPYFIDLDFLCDDKLLTKKDLNSLKVNNKKSINYSYLYKTRFKVLYKAYQNGISRYSIELNKFLNKNSQIKDYALFMSIKEYFNMKQWSKWPDEGIRKRKGKSLLKYKELLSERIEFYEFIQFLFFKQYINLKNYANSKGIKIFGDIPIYVSYDSCDCWMNPECFLLDKNYIPKCVAGVPPDYFTKNGQLWGNPLYNYKHMKKDSYNWWIKRISLSSKLYDVIRIDHFRGFESFWSVPYGDTTAKNGKWIKGPNMDLLNVIKKNNKSVDFIAEDLGYLTDNVKKMLINSGFPGMKVLEFGFDSREKSDHSPDSCPSNSVCYIGTHDNSTIIGWLKSAKKDDVKCALKYLNASSFNNFNWKMIKVGMNTKSKIFIVQMQDYLGLDDKARINKPGTLGKNWKWRATKSDFNKKLAKKIANVTVLSNRAN